MSWIQQWNNFSSKCLCKFVGFFLFFFYLLIFLPLPVRGLYYGRLFRDLGQFQECAEKLGKGHRAQTWSSLRQQDHQFNGDVSLNLTLWASFLKISQTIRPNFHHYVLSSSDISLTCDICYPGERNRWQGGTWVSVAGALPRRHGTLSVDWQRSHPPTVEPNWEQASQIWAVLGARCCRLHRWDFATASSRGRLIKVRTAKER